MAERHAPLSTTEKGRAGEDLAASHLQGLGYQLIARNVRAAGAEIDIVAREGPLLCFVEVRRRKKTLDALVSVDARKQRRLIRAATAYIARLRPIPRCRFDVVVVGPEGVRLVRGAFEARP